MKLLRYFFYRKIEEEPKLTPAAWVVPSIATSAMVTLNVISLAAIISEMFGARMLENMTKVGAAVTIVPTAIVVFGVIYVAWIRNERYVQFSKEFRDESARLRGARTVLILAYQLMSLMALPVVAIIAHARRS